MKLLRAYNLLQHQSSFEFLILRAFRSQNILTLFFKFKGTLFNVLENHKKIQNMGLEHLAGSSQLILQL